MKIFTLQLFGILAGGVIASLCSCSGPDRKGNEHAQPGSEKSAVLTIPAFEEVDDAVKTQIAGFLKGYFILNQALIEDSLAGAKVAADGLSQIKRTFEMSKFTSEQMDFYLVQSSLLKSGLLDISNSKDIEMARAGLASVSEAMYALVKAFHPNESTLYYQYCPMARNNQGANWLSVTEELANPYMGQMMLQCGRTQEKLEVTMNSK